MNRVAGWLLTAALLIPAAVSAQSQFALRVQVGDNVTQVANGTTLSFSSPAPGTTRTARLMITYLGNTSATFPNGVSILGSTAFTAQPVSGGTPGSTLLPNQTATIDVIFNPTTTDGAVAQFGMDFVEAPAVSGGSALRGIIALGLTGGVPVYSLAYVFGTTGNTVVVQPNGTVAFPDTVLNSSSSAVMSLTNRGAGVGQVTSISISGGAFALASVPALPVTIATGSAVAFQVVYTPRQTGGDTGTLTLGFDGGVTQTYQLSGQGITSQLTYQVIPQGGTASPIAPGQSIQFPQTQPGQTSKVQLRYTNGTASDVIIAGFAVTGAPYALSDLPLTPVTLPPSASGTITISFTPTQTAAVTGGLRVGNDNFTLAGNAQGPSLTYSYQAAGTSVTTPVDPAGTVTVPSAAVGKSSSVVFTVRNQGNAAAVINSIGLTSDGTGAYRITGLPSLPYQLDPQASASFTVQFIPNNTGFISGALRIDSATFTLSGFALTPVPLPDYTLSGPTQLAPLEQPTVTLTLSQPYSIPLTGTLKLTQASTYGTDSAVQFSSGGTTVTFTIPANTTQAVFPNGTTSIRYQAGTVAGTITVTPAFATQAGLDLTPSSPTVSKATMNAAAPQILGVNVVERSTNSVTLRTTGITTTRSLTNMTISFTAASGFDVTNLSFPLDLSGGATAWFASTASQAFGGQFAIDVQFLLTTSDRNTGALPPALALQAATVTISNPTGTSNSVTVNLQ